LRRTEIIESPWGLSLIVFGIGVHLISAIFRIYFSSGFSMLIVLAGFILHFWGAKVFKKVAFPIAIITNVCRVIILSLISEIWGAEYASGFVHGATGFMVFALAFLLLWTTSKLIE